VTQQEEQYIHLVSCGESFNDARHTLQEIKQSRSHPLIGAAFQFAVIQYSKPYLNSRGIAGKHKLDDRYIPPMHRDLHNRLIATRNQILAHADLTVMEAKLHVADISSGQRAFIVQNVIHGTMELSNIDSIIDLVKQTLIGVYAERDRLEGQLLLTMGAV
jgi:hypothetical protein